MLIRHAEQQLGTVAGVRDGPGESAPAPPMRIPNRGESNSSFPCPWTSAAFGRRALYARRNWQARGAEVSGRIGWCWETETIVAWYRRLIARKFDGSKHRSYP